MDISRMTDGSNNWQIIHVDTAANVLDLYNKIQANLTQLQTDAGVIVPPPVITPPVTVPPVTTPPAKTGFRGIFAFNNMTQTSLFSDNPNVAGTVLTYYWAQLEPQPGQFNWSIIDNDMKPWIAAGKSVIIRVSASGWKNWQPKQNSVQGTPQWVFDQGVKHVTDSDGSIKPEYWNPKFLSNLADFIHALAAKYDGNPYVVCIEMGIGDGGETKVDTGKDPNLLKLWQGIGYTDAAWYGAITSIINMYVQNFTKTPLALMPDASFIGGTSGYNEQKVIDYIIKLNNRNVWVQDNGLIGGKPLPSSLASLPKGWPLLSEQRNDTATSGTTLESDLSTAISQGAVCVLVFTTDLQNTKNAATLAKYAATVGK
jgi:hypothetical protein